MRLILRYVAFDFAMIMLSPMSIQNASVSFKFNGTAAYIYGAKKDDYVSNQKFVHRLLHLPMSMNREAILLH
jgi:hypothetical protein